MEPINIALPKGRLGKESYRIFAQLGLVAPELLEENRKLLFENGDVRYFWVKPSDVGIYVERGIADMGVVGKDVLLESEPNVYELMPLDMGHCVMAVAGYPDFREDPYCTLKVATKYPHIAQRHFAKRSRPIDIIRLSGSVEIAPVIGLSDVIVDIVETGATLAENGLEILETITPISARLIAHKPSYKFQYERMEAMVHQLMAMEGGAR